MPFIQTLDNRVAEVSERQPGFLLSVKMKTIIITVVAVGVITGVAGYLGGRVPVHYPVRTDSPSFTEDRQTKLERVFGARSAKYVETLSKAERKTLSQPKEYSRIEREIQHSDVEIAAVEIRSEKDTEPEGILKLSAPEIPVNNREQAAVPGPSNPEQAEVKQLLQDGESAEKQNLQLLQTDAGQKVNKEASVTLAKVPDSVEKNSGNKYSRTEAKIEAGTEINTINAPQVIGSSSKQVIGKSDFNYEKNFKTIAQEIIPPPAPQVSSKSQPQIVVLHFSSKGKSEKKKVKVIISGMDYSIPMGSITYGNLNSLRNKLSNK